MIFFPARNPACPARPPLPPEQIRSAVLSMLAEAGDAEPPTGERFRKIVSVRKLRARLGAGDPATLSRELNAIEADVVRAGLTDIGTHRVSRRSCARSVLPTWRYTP